MCPVRSVTYLPGCTMGVAISRSPVTINHDVLVTFVTVRINRLFQEADPAASLSVPVPVFQRVHPPASPRVDPEASRAVPWSAAPRVDYPAVFPDRLPSNVDLLQP